MSAPTFESLRIWHDARRLTIKIYEVTRSSAFAQDFALRDQIRRAMLSVMSNIAEGYERGGKKEFLHFLRIAKGSAGEVRSQLYAAQDVGYLKPEVAGELRRHAASLARQIAWIAENRG
jgi:four helix bundle protein